MQKFLGPILVFCAMSLFIHQAKAETYFLTIGQNNNKDSKTFLQTCSAETAPCTFIMPVMFEKGKTKNIAIVMRIKEPPYVYLQFYWDQTQLETNNSGVGHYTLLAGTSDTKTEPRIVGLYAPLPPEQTPKETEPVLKYSEKLISSLKVSAIMTKE